MRPRKLAMRSLERRKRFDKLLVVAGNVVRREAEDLFNQEWANDRSDRDQNDDDETKHCQLVLEQPAPRITPERRAADKLARIRVRVFRNGFFGSDLEFRL